MAITDTFTLACEAAAVLGKLKHSYLENTLLFITHPADLLEALDQVEVDRTRKEEIERLFKRLMDILDSPERGFSPAQLVDRLAPFRDLITKERSRLRAALHDYYLRDFQPRMVRDRIEKIGGDFFTAMDEFVRNTRNDSGCAKTFMSLKALRGLTKKLHGEIESLPRGMWLWRT